MSVSTSALNLADYALNSNSPMVRAITWSLIDNGSVAQDIPFLTKQTLLANGVRFEGNLPSVNWAQINSEGVTVKATPKAYQEQVFTFRNYIDVDKILVMDENQITDPRATQAAAYMKAMSYDFNYKFINNNHATGDANSITGIRYRIDNGSTFGVRSENKIDGAALDLRRANATQATANTLIELLDQLLWSVDSPDGTGVTLYMNEVMKRRLAFLARLMGTSGGFDITRDQFDRVITMYKGAVIRDIGYKADQSTRIITNTENTDGTDGSSVQTSIYAVNYSTEHFFGWQMYEPNVQDLGLLNNGVIYRTLIDWALGLMNNSTRSLGRLYDLKMA
jgi:major capsid protein gp7